MSADRDFMLGVGLELLTDDIEAIASKVEKALASIPALKLKLIDPAQLETLAESFDRVTQRSTQAGTQGAASLGKIASEARNATDAINQETTAVERATVAQREWAADPKILRAQVAEKMRGDAEEYRSSLQQSLQLARDTTAQLERGANAWRGSAKDSAQTFIDDANSRMAEAQRANASMVSDENARGRGSAARSASVFRDNFNLQDMRDAEAAQANSSMTSEQDSTGRGNARRSAGAFQEAWQNHLESLAPAAQYVTQYNALNDAIDKNSQALDRGLPKLQARIAAQEKVRTQLPDVIRNYHSLGDEIVNMAGKTAAWEAGLFAIDTLKNVLGKGFGDAMRSQKEQAITGLYYDAASDHKTKYTPEMSDEAQQAAILLARKYGDDVMHVQEATGLWAKVTKGELAPALFLTNEAMKLNAVSGMNMEEIYRSTVGALSQTHQPLSKTVDLYNMAIGLALKYGGGVQSLEGENQDMVRQMMEGIDRSATVLGEAFGKANHPLERTAALIAAIVHNTNELGPEIGSKLSSAFAKLEEAKAAKILKPYGISVDNNPELLQQLHDKWGSLGQELSSVIKPQDMHVIKTAIDNVNGYKKALDDAFKAEKEHAADKALETIMKTTSFQVAQLRAGFEAAGITLGREFLPDINRVVGALNTELIPSILANKQGIAQFVQDAGKFALVMVSLNLVKGGIAGTLRTWESLTTFMTTVIPQAVSVQDAYMQASETSLQTYQREMLRTTVNSEEDLARMEEAVKVWAIQHKTSIDEVIAEILKLGNQVETTSTVVVGAEARMAQSMQLLAATTGTEVGVIEEQFGQLETSAAATAGAMRVAFMSAIPVIGAIATAGFVGYEAIQYFKGKHNKEHDREMMTDPKAFNAQAHEFHQQLDQSNQQVDYWKRQRKEYVRLYGSGDSASLNDIDSNLNKARNDKEKAYEGLGHLKGLFDQQRASKDASEQLAAAKRMATQYIGAKGDFLHANDKTGAIPAKGASSAPSQLAEANRQVSNSIQKKIDTQNNAIDADRKALVIAERMEKLYGVQASTIGRVSSAYTKYIADVQSAHDTLSKQAGALRGESESAHRKSLSAGGTHTKQGLSYQKEADSLLAKSEQLVSRAEKLKNEVKNLTSESGLHSAASVIASTHDSWHRLRTTLNSTIQADGRSALGKGGGPAEMKAYEDALRNAITQATHFQHTLNSFKDSKGVQALADYISNVNGKLDAAVQKTKEWKQAASDLDTEVSTQMQDMAVQMASPFDKHIQEAMKATLQLQREYRKESETLGRVNDVAGQQQLDYLTRQKAALISLTLAQQEYQDRVKDLQGSLGFGILSTSLGTVGQTLDDSMMNRITGKTGTNDKVRNLENQVNNLEFQKSLLIGKRYAAERLDLDDQVKRLQIQIKAYKDAQANPSLIKKVWDDVWKSIIDDSTKKFEKAIKDAVTQGFLGDGPKQAQDKQKAQMDSFVTNVTNAFKGANGDLGNNFKTFGASVDELSTNLQDFINSFGPTSDIANGMTGYGGGSGGTAPQANPFTSFLQYNSAGGSAGGFSALSVLLGGGLLLGQGGAGSGNAIVGPGSIAGFFGAGASGGGVPGGESSGGGGGHIIDTPFGKFSSNSKAGKLFGNLFGNASDAIGHGGGISTLMQSEMYAQMFGQMMGGGSHTQWAELGGAIGSFIPIPGAGAALSFVGSLFGHADNQSAMPDKYNKDQFGQTEADLVGAGINGSPTYNASGTPYSESQSVQQVTKGQSEIGFIEEQLAKGKPSWMTQDMYNQFVGAFGTSATGAGKLNYAKDIGKEWITGAQGANGQQMSYTDLGNMAQEFLQNYANGQNKNLGPIYSFNQYGGKPGMPQRLSNIPGLNATDIKNFTQSPYAINPAMASPSGTNSPGAVQNGQTVTVNVPVKVSLDGKTIYENTMSYARQRENMGFDMNY